MLTGDAAIEPGGVALVGLAPRELPLERREGLWILGDEQQPGGLELEGVHDERLGGIRGASPEPNEHRVTPQGVAAGDR